MQGPVVRTVFVLTIGSHLIRTCGYPNFRS
ncbi:hypothetical protein CORC01_14172 [Colletotrichum orchidophilum]|uniref:Uncharacterized protein n=1 Tax=Colletotrichum orchidophilum TaxID=1209926 RepID=A0A1G4ANB1_9PEZI|nr:uncharacterized protein CORC01_14172 [Colletotrichum orchidophilum]OHE90533.1 hypothetical protein CORC01_14172 [Colletotrichum orchidophilum]